MYKIGEPCTECDEGYTCEDDLCAKIAAAEEEPAAEEEEPAAEEEEPAAKEEAENEEVAEGQGQVIMYIMIL